MVVFLVAAVLAAPLQRPASIVRAVADEEIDKVDRLREFNGIVLEAAVVFVLVRERRRREEPSAQRRHRDAPVEAELVRNLRRALDLVRDREVGANELPILVVHRAEVTEQVEAVRGPEHQLGLDTLDPCLRRVDRHEASVLVERRDDEVVVIGPVQGQVGTQPIVEQLALESCLIGFDGLGVEQDEVQWIRHSRVPAAGLEPFGIARVPQQVFALPVFEGDLRSEFREGHVRRRASSLYVARVPQRQESAIGTGEVTPAARCRPRDHHVLDDVDRLVFLGVSAAECDREVIRQIVGSLREYRVAFGIVVQGLAEVTGNRAAEKEQFVTYRGAVLFLHVEDACEPVEFAGRGGEREFLADLFVVAVVGQHVLGNRVIGQVDQVGLVEVAPAGDRLQCHVTNGEFHVQCHAELIGFRELALQATDDREEILVRIAVEV